MPFLTFFRLFYQFFYSNKAPKLPQMQLEFLVGNNGREFLIDCYAHSLKKARNLTFCITMIKQHSLQETFFHAKN